jgi:Protein of unknown function (DUF642)
MWRQLVPISAVVFCVAACGGGRSSSSTPLVSSTVGNSSTSESASTTTGPVVSDDVTTPPSGGCEGNSLLVDCSFESPVVAVGGYQLFTVGGDFSGWTVIGAPGNVAPLSEAFASAGFVWAAQDGKQTLDLTGLSNTPTGVSQPVTTTAGRTYNLSFWIGNIVNPGGSYGTQTSVKVLVDGVQIDAAVNSDGAGLKSPAYEEFTDSFTATSSSTTVAFVNADPSSDNSSIIDDITLIAAP